MLKPGDKVRCISEAGNAKLGKTYVIHLVKPEHVYLKDDNFGYYSHRFVKISGLPNWF